MGRPYENLTTFLPAARAHLHLLVVLHVVAVGDFPGVGAAGALGHRDIPAQHAFGALVAQVKELTTQVAELQLRPGGDEYLAAKARWERGDYKA